MLHNHVAQPLPWCAAEAQRLLESGQYRSVTIKRCYNDPATGQPLGKVILNPAPLLPTTNRRRAPGHAAQYCHDNP